SPPLPRGALPGARRHPHPSRSPPLWRAGHPRVADAVQRARGRRQSRRPGLHGGPVDPLPGDAPPPRAAPARLRARRRVHALPLPSPAPARAPLRSAAEAAVTERVRLSRLVQVFASTGLTSLGGGR